MEREGRALIDVEVTRKRTAAATGYHSYPPIRRSALQSIALPAYLWATLILLLQPVRACPNNQYKYNVLCLSQPCRLKYSTKAEVDVNNNSSLNICLVIEISQRKALCTANTFQYPQYPPPFHTHTRNQALHTSSQLIPQNNPGEYRCIQV